MQIQLKRENIVSPPKGGNPTLPDVFCTHQSEYICVEGFISKNTRYTLCCNLLSIIYCKCLSTSPPFSAPGFNPLHPVKSIRCRDSWLPSHAPADEGRLMISSGAQRGEAEAQRTRGNEKRAPLSLGDQRQLSLCTAGLVSPLYLEQVIQLSIPGSGYASAPKSHS